VSWAIICSIAKNKHGKQIYCNGNTLEQSMIGTKTHDKWEKYKHGLHAADSEKVFILNSEEFIKIAA